MIELYPYQQESIIQLREGFRRHQRQVLCLPTGSGKTVVFSEMVRLAAERGTRTLVLTDRIELFEQTFSSLKKSNIHPQIITAQTKNIYDAPISVAMVETIYRRISKGAILTPNLI